MRNNPPANPKKPPQKPGVNRELIRQALVSWKMPKVDTQNPQAIADRIEEYLAYCMENDCPPSVTGCANWIGVTLDALRDWYTGRYGSPQHQQVMINFYAIMQQIWAQDMHDGNINPVAGIFMGKVFYGYKDTQEIVVQQNGAASAKSNAELIAESKLLPGADRLALPDGTQTIDIEARVVEPQKERAAEKSAESAEGAERPKNKGGRPRKNDGLNRGKRQQAKVRAQKEKNRTDLMEMFGDSDS